MAHAVHPSDADMVPTRVANDDAASVALVRSQKALVEAVVFDILVGRVVTPVQGGRGAGKTTLLRAVVARLREEGRLVVAMEAGQHAPADIQASLAAASEVPPGPKAGAGALFRYMAAVPSLQMPALVLDEAERLPPATLQYLKLLLDLSQRSALRVQLVLFGGPLPWAGLAGDGLEPLRTEVALAVGIPPFGGKEARLFVESRFAAVMPSARPTLGPAAVRKVVRQAGGNPRQLEALAAAAIDAAAGGGSGGGPSHAWRYAVAASLLVAALAGGGVAERWNRRDASPAPAEAPSGPIALVAPSPAALVPPAAVEAPAVAPGGAPGVATVAPPTEMAQGRPDREPPSAPTEAPAPYGIAGPAPAAGGAERAEAPPPEPALAAAVAGHPVLDHDLAAAAAAAAIPPEAPRRTPGFVFVAQDRDSMPELYNRMYRGLRPPSYAEMLAANHDPIRPGALVVLPEPPGGWAPGRSPSAERHGAD